MLSNILHRLSDGWDIITLGQVTPTLYMLSEDRQLWKKLCQYHFAEKQVITCINVNFLCNTVYKWCVELVFWGKNVAACGNIESVGSSVAYTKDCIQYVWV